MHPLPKHLLSDASVCTLQVADEIKKCKTPDDIRDRFNIRFPVAAPFAMFLHASP